MFDYDQDGIISVEDMRHLAQDIKEDRNLTDEEILSMIDHLDHEGNSAPRPNLRPRPDTRTMS